LRPSVLLLEHGKVIIMHRIYQILNSATNQKTVVAYSNTYDCNADDNTKYRFISGAGDLTRCMTFDQDMPGTSCEEFRNGGTSHGGCNTGSLIPESVVLRAGRCVIYAEPGCKSVPTWDSRGPVNTCRSFILPAVYVGPIRSFWCSGCKISSTRYDMSRD
jgi:hypothetical protein